VKPEPQNIASSARSNPTATNIGAACPKGGIELCRGAPIAFTSVVKKPEAKKVPHPDPLIRWAADHAPLLATGLIFAFIVVRVLRVSEFDPATATTLIRESGPVSVVTGVLATSLPDLMIPGMVFLLILAQGGPGTPTQRRAAILTVGTAFLVLVVVIPWAFLLRVFLLLVVIFFAQRRLKWPLEYFAVVAVLVTFLLDVPVMWLPPERVELMSRDNVTGYVLATDSEWTSVLLEEDREVLIVRTYEVSERTVCNVEDPGKGRTLSQLLLREEGGLRNPLCTKLAEDEAESP
jgi:hypothetical protein